MPARRIDGWIAMFFFVGGLAYYLSYAGTFLNLPSLNDEGFLLYGGVRVLQGQLPVADFWAYPPGRYWLFAACFKVFGISVGVERTLLAVLMSSKNVLAWSVARRLMPRTPAALAVLTITLVPGPWHKFDYSLLLFAQLTALLFYLDRPSTRRAACCGLLAGAAFYLRQDSAAYGLITCAVLISLAQPPWRRPRAWLTHGFSVLGGFLLMLVPLAVMYRHDLPLVLRRLANPLITPNVVYEMVNFVSPRRMWWALGSHLAHWPDPLFIRGLLSWVTAAIAGIGALSLLWGRHTAVVPLTRALGRRRLIWAAVTISSLLTLTKMFMQPDVIAVLMAGQGAVLMGFAMAWWLWRRRQWAVGVVAWSVMGLAWLQVLMMAVVYVEDTEAGSWPRSYREAGELRVPRATLELDAKQAATLERLVALVQARTTPEQTIYAWKQPMLYVLCERDNATLTDSTVPPVFLRDWQEHMLEVFTQRPPALQILSAHRGWSWIAAKYPPQLRTAMFAGYRVTDDLGAYLVLEYTGQGDAYDDSVRWLQKKLDGEP
jgi:Dolichyl-phosphate-mannose-protein mannosyltransferase